VAGRVGVSERAFDEVFGSVEDCFSAAFEEGLRRLSEVVVEAAGRERQWLGRVRAGLVALLGFLEDEPGWGRLLVFHAPLDGAVVLRCQQRVHRVLTELVDDGSSQAIGEVVPESRLTVELVVGGVLSVICTRMLEAGGDAGAGDGVEVGDGTLVELAPSLMAFIVRPYLGQAAASAELVGRSAAGEQVSSRAVESAVALPESAVPLPVPFHHRTALVLRAIACEPRSSNSEIAEAAGIADKGQISRLLRGLARRGLIEKVAPRSGSRRENAWLLTPCGRRVIKLLGVETAADPRACASVRVGEAA
jgi:AcrR family transcriptional regulator